MQIKYTLNIESNTSIDITLPTRPTEEEPSQAMEILSPLLRVQSGINLSIQPESETVSEALKHL